MTPEQVTAEARAFLLALRVFPRLAVVETTRQVRDEVGRLVRR